MFIFERERERERAWAGESEPGSRLWAVSTEPNAGLELTDCEIMTRAEVGRSTDWATQAPQDLISLTQMPKADKDSRDRVAGKQML